MKIPFSPPFIDDDVKAEVMDVLNSGWITSGPRVRELENMISELAQTPKTVCCNSATSGLMLALHWFGVGRGDEVIIPAYTYAATALSVMHLGAVPVMVDSGDDFNINVALISEKITSKTKVIIPVDIAGWPCDYSSLLDLVNDEKTKALFQPASEHQRLLGRILLLGDSAHAIGSVYKDKPVGRWSDLTVFSLHAVKNVTTAEGGAIALNLPAPFDAQQVYQLLKLWALNGQTKDALAKSQAGDWKYDIVYAGFKMNMPDICAAIGVAQMRKYKSDLIVSRKRVNDAYRDGFFNYSWAQLPMGEDATGQSSYHLYALRIKGINEEQRNRMITHIAQKEISVNVHFQPLPLLTVFKERGYSIADFPVAYDSYSREISLPIYPQLTSEHTDFIIAAVIEAYENVIIHEKTV